MNIVVKKVVAVILLMAIILTNTPIYVIAATDTTPPSMVISGLSSSTVAYQGETMSFKVSFSDETAMGTINFNANYVVPIGFKGNVSVSETGNIRTVTISGINDDPTIENKIMIRAGAAVDAMGNKSKVFSSSAFTITERPDTTKPSVIISRPSLGSVVEGGTVKYTVAFSDETAMGTVNFNANYIALIGFEADVVVTGEGNTRYVTLSNITGAADSDNKISVRAGAVKDAAGNVSAVATSTAFTITGKPDTTKPSVIISTPSLGSVVEGGTVKYTVAFSDETAMGTVNFNANYVALIGFEADVVVTGEGNTRYVTLSNITGAADSDNKISIRAGAVKDAAGNVSAVVTSTAFEIIEPIRDITKPSVVMSKPSPLSVVEGGTVKYTVVFSDETAMGIVNFNKNYVALIGFEANVVVEGTGNTRTVILSNITGAADSDNKISIRAGAAKDAAGNTSAVVTSTAFTIDESPKDLTRPSVVISKPSPLTTEVGGTVKYTVVFSDETAMGTVNFNANYVALIGFEANVVVEGTGNTRTVILSNIEGKADADNKIVIRAGAAKDAAGNSTVVTESTTFSIYEVAKDTTVPSVVISKPSPLSVDVGGTVSYTVVFSDETAMGTVNFNENYVALIGFEADVTVTGTGNTRVVTLSNVQGTADSNNRIAIRAGAAVDAAGNRTKVVESTNFTVTIPTPQDITAPSVIVSKPSPLTTEVGGTVKYTVVFSDETAMGTINFNKNYVALIGFEANIEVTGEGNIRTVTLTNVKGEIDSENRIAIRAGAAVDAAGNKTKVVESTNFTMIAPPVIDTTVPSVVISKPSPLTTEVGGTVKYTVVFSDETAMGTINFNKNYVALIGFEANIIVTGEGNTKTVTLTDIRGDVDSDNRIVIRAGAAVDAAGNRSKVVESTNFTVKETVVRDTVLPVVKIAAAQPGTIYVNGTVKYIVTFEDNVSIAQVNLYASKIKTMGFDANISIKMNGLKSAEITLSKIKGTIGSNKYIVIASGVALDAEGNRSLEVESPKFSIIEKVKPEDNDKPTDKPVENPVEKPTIIEKADCIDDLKLIGDVNKEIKYFASWLKAEKDLDTIFAQEHNYVAKGEEMTYIIEYFNGNTTAATNVGFELTIPYGVEVIELNGAGKVTEQTYDKTVITWNMGTVDSFVASNNSGYCRLYVKVKFLQNVELEASKNISEEFYATLKTTANSEESYSYMRQLFIDLTEGKVGTYNNSLLSIDALNEVRPNEEITRAEFAKLLVDAGIIEVDYSSKAYKNFKDYETIPVYARAAVAALVKAEIIKPFADETFKPNNPILMEDAIQILVDAASYMSEQKLAVSKPVFINTEALTGKDGEISPKKDYIMELIRQNVVSAKEVEPDSYILRKEAVKMVNSLAFRGPVVRTLPENELKFANVRDGGIVFYNVAEAMEPITYVYTYKLWQQLVDIK